MRDSLPKALGEFGTYRDLELLGRGGAASVYRAVRSMPGIDQEVALKVFPQVDGPGDPHLDAFRDEARLLLEFDHPAIVQVYEFDVVDTRPCIAMELLRGGSVEDLLAQREQAGSHGLEPNRLLEIGAEVAEALDYIHRGRGRSGTRLRAVHRDLKPANVLLASSGQPKLADFGIARSLLDEREITAEGVVNGTPHYMAPEQLQSEGKVDGRADIFALGLLLFRMATGSHLNPAADHLQAVWEVMNPPGMRGQLDKRQVERKQVERRLPGLWSVIASCVETEPHKRPNNASVVRDRLLEIQTKGDGGEARSSAPKVPAIVRGTNRTIRIPDPKTPKRRGLKSLVVLIWLVVVVFGGLALLHLVDNRPADTSAEPMTAGPAHDSEDAGAAERPAPTPETSPVLVANRQAPVRPAPSARPTPAGRSTSKNEAAVPRPAEVTPEQTPDEPPPPASDAQIGDAHGKLEGEVLRLFVLLDGDHLDHTVRVGVADWDDRSVELHYAEGREWIGTITRPENATRPASFQVQLLDSRGQVIDSEESRL